MALKNDDKAHRSAISRAYYLKNKDKWKARADKNRDHIAAIKRAHYLKNLAVKKALDRAYYLANAERKRAWQREYYQSHRKEVLAIAKVWREKNPERVKQNTRAYRDTHRDEHRVDGARRRAAKASAPIGSFTGKDWAEMKAAYGYRCVYCTLKRPLTQDHVIPLVKGGKHDKSNIVPACRPCNSRKNARPAPPYQPVLYAI